MPLKFRAGVGDKDYDAQILCVSQNLIDATSGMKCGLNQKCGTSKNISTECQFHSESCRRYYIYTYYIYTLSYYIYTLVCGYIPQNLVDAVSHIPGYVTLIKSVAPSRTSELNINAFQNLIDAIPGWISSLDQEYGSWQVMLVALEWQAGEDGVTMYKLQGGARVPTQKVGVSPLLSV